jgi:purine nucleoside phosphorylase
MHSINHVANIEAFGEIGVGAWLVVNAISYGSLQPLVMMYTVNSSDLKE